MPSRFVSKAPRASDTPQRFALGAPRRGCAPLAVRAAAQPKGQHKSLTDFHTVLGEENLAPALRFLTAKRPSLKHLHA